MKGSCTAKRKGDHWVRWLWRLKEPVVEEEGRERLDRITWWTREVKWIGDEVSQVWRCRRSTGNQTGTDLSRLSCTDEVWPAPIVQWKTRSHPLRLWLPLCHLSKSQSYHTVRDHGRVKSERKTYVSVNGFIAHCESKLHTAVEQTFPSWSRFREDDIW